MPSARVAAALLACMSGALPAHADSQLSLSSGLDYSSGKYGGTLTTEIWYVPLTARLESGDWQYKLTVPYVRMRAPSGGVIIGYDDNGLPIRDGVGTPVTEDGLGDVVAAATYSLVARPDLLLDLTGKVKFGTASVSRGLGTGENDLGAAMDAYFPMGKATPFLGLSYRWPGDPQGQDLRNTWGASAGLAYKHSAQWSMGAMLDWRSAATAASTPHRDLLLYAVYKPGGAWKFQVYFDKGFSDSSPDHGLGLMATLSF